MRLREMSSTLPGITTGLEVLGGVGVVLGVLLEHARERLLAIAVPSTQRALMDGAMRLGDVLRVYEKGIDLAAIGREWLRWGIMVWLALPLLIALNAAARGWWCQGGKWRVLVFWGLLTLCGTFPAASSVMFVLGALQMLLEGVIDSEIVSEGTFVAGAMGVIAIGDVGRAVIALKGRRRLERGSQMAKVG